VLTGVRHHHDRKKENAVVAATLMSSPPVTIGPAATVEQAAELMYERRIKRLPVVDSAGRLIGIVSRSDVLTVFRRPDEEIAREIRHGVVLMKFLVDPSTIHVTVQDGIVTLAGRPETDAVGHGIVDEVRHVAGVVAVRDRFTYAGKNPAIPLPI
jgi:CBS-domain-containing membrane protein